MTTVLMHLVTTLGGISVGGIMKFMSESAKARDDRDKMLHNIVVTNLKVEDQSKELARKDQSKETHWGRRFITVSVLLAVIAAMFLGGLIGIETSVPVKTPEYSLLGLFSWGGETVYQKIKGFIAFPELFLWGNSIVSFYLGSTVMKR